MVARIKSQSDQTVLILFSTKVLSAIDLIRAVMNVDETEPAPPVEDQEVRLAERIGEHAARVAMSDALLFSFALRRQKHAPFTFAPPESRHGTRDEFSLLTLIAAAGVDAHPLIIRAASALQIEPTETILNLAADLSKSLHSLFLGVDFLDAERFDAVTREGGWETRMMDPDDPGMKFYF